MDNLTIIKKEWFPTSTGLIGIIIAQDNITEETKYYMGVGVGINEQDDVKTILERGTKLNFNRMRNIFR